jgi:hypothetical protein
MQVDACNDFGAARTKLDEAAKDYQIHIHIDTDEVWDSNLIANLAKYCDKDRSCWKIARCNLPHGNAFPDYQVRLFWYTPNVSWKGKVHEKLYLGDTLYDQVNVNILPFVIIHRLRNEKLNRPWWK